MHLPYSSVCTKCTANTYTKCTASASTICRASACTNYTVYACIECTAITCSKCLCKMALFVYICIDAYNFRVSTLRFFLNFTVSMLILAGEGRGNPQ